MPYSAPTLYAPPELLSAFAFAVDGSDPDLRKGTHLRIYAGLGSSFPLAPFAIFRLTGMSTDLRTIVSATRDQQQIGLTGMERGVIDTTLAPIDSVTRRTVRIEGISSGGGIRGAALLDQYGRIIAARNSGRWLFSAPMLHRLMVWGDVQAIHLRAIAADPQAFAASRGGELAAVMGLPIQGVHPWYCGVQTRDDALQRVTSGAPLRLSPADRPDGPFDAVGAAEETSRVEDFLDAFKLGGGLEATMLRMVSDGALPPWAQFDVEQLSPASDPPQYATSNRLGLLQTAAADPGIARLCGFATHLDDLPDLDGPGWNTLAVVGLIAFDAQQFARRLLDFNALLREPAVAPDLLLQRLITALEHASGRNLRGAIERVIATARAKGLTVGTYVTFAAPVPPWLPPPLPSPQVIQRHWQQSAGDAPSASFRASFAFPHMPMAVLSALARFEGGTWRCRQDLLPVVPERAKPALFGREVDSNARQLELGLTPRTQDAAGLLTDYDIPVADGAVHYRARAADFFGRYGDPVEFLVDAPPRPIPPKPVLRMYLKHASVDPTSNDPASPGQVQIVVAIPHPAPADRYGADELRQLGAAVQVPRLDDLAAGALALAKLELTLGAEQRVVDLSQPGFVTVEFELPELGPQQPGAWALSGVFQDTMGQRSDVATLQVTARDRRPPTTYPAGIGLFWTSAPGPAPEVELRLQWKGTPSSLHRVYLCDQVGLGLTSDDLPVAPPARQPSRGLVAAVGCRKVIDGFAGQRDGFRLLTEPPVQAGADGVATLNTTLPRSLETVQFLRVVPLGPDGAEPAFESCGIVPIAVPASRRPPAPHLEGRVDPDTGVATLIVTAEGFDRVELERDEPGLFRPGAKGNSPPRFVLRRAVGAVADPIYARQVATGALALVSTSADDALFEAELSDTNGGGGLVPFVRYVYWAQVQLPPERRLPADFDSLDLLGGVTPVDPAAAASHPHPPSLPSAACVLMHVPPAPPPVPDLNQVSLSRSPVNATQISVGIQFMNPPKAHVLAVDRFRAAIWIRRDGQSYERITNANGADLVDGWPIVEDGLISVRLDLTSGATQATPIEVRFAYIDPAGRVGPLQSKALA